jgi:hypothetical protein
MFLRNVADYAEPALAELAWIDPDIRSFWIEQARAVAADLTDLGDVRNAAPTERPHRHPRRSLTSSRHRANGPT